MRELHGPGSLSSRWTPLINNKDRYLRKFRIFEDMRKIVDYAIKCGDRSILVSEVRDAISKGWQPLGTPYISGSGTMYQTMVMYEEPEKGFEDLDG